MIPLDKTDKALLNLLQENGKQSIKQLANGINLSITPTYERLKKLENNGIIDKYVALINPMALDKKLIVYCQITIVKHQEKYFEAFEKFVTAMDEIIEVSYVAGSNDLILKIILNDMNEYQEFVMKKLSQLEIIGNIQSSFVIKQVKHQTKIPLH